MTMLLHDHADFSAFVRIVAQERGIRAAIVEKDYWVTYVLQKLQKSEFKDVFIFKGGTSLSKGWNLIDRFSEDVDLLLVADGLSGKAKKNRMKKIQEFVNALDGLKFDEGNRDNRAGNESRTSCFKYDTILADDLGSLLPYIKLEMGFRGGNEPKETRNIQSLVGTALQAKNQLGVGDNVLGVEMPLLHPRRTLVEKLFAIYSAYEDKKITGKTRHYYDVFRLLELPEVTGFLGTTEYTELKESVSSFSRENWPESSLPHGNALAGTPAFNPEGAMRTQIEHEYVRSDIYYGTKPSFGEIIDRIQRYQNKF